MIADSSIETRSQGRTTRASVLLAALAAFLFASVAPAAEIVGSARLIAERESHTATLLGKGSVLVVGGRSSSGPIAVAEIYDPTTRSFSVAGTSLQARADHAAVRLSDGRVLILGGRGRDQALESTEIYDSKTNTFSAGPSLTHARFGHTATLLADGRVVVIGGDATGCAEIYEPSTGLFKELEQCLSVPRRLHAAVVLRDGNVLVAGGVGADGAPLASAEILNLATLSFLDAPIPMLAARSGLTLRLLPDGKVQAIGGDDAATMELFNPTGRYFTSLGHLGQDRQVLAAALRNTGRTALIGSPGSARPSLTRLSAESAGLGTAMDVLDRSSYTLTELPGANAAILVGGLTSGALQQRAVLFSSSSATITTDKTDYAPGETVIITGTGWLPGETVSLNLHRDTNDPPDTVLTAVANANGNIQNSEYVCQQSDVGVTFLLTATGQTSGFTAQTTFTDGNVRVQTNGVGRTFDLDWARFDGADCTGTAVASGTEDDVGNTNGTQFNQGVGNTEFIRLTAETFSDEGGAFLGWTSSNTTGTEVTPDIPATSLGPNSTNLEICVPGAFTGNRLYLAHYGLCVNPTISVGGQPVSQTVCPGSSASFSVTATGTNLSYQWRKNGSPLSNGGNVSGATSATLTINPATAADNGSYTVVISGNCGSPVTSAAATLTVADTTAPVPTVATLPTVTGQCSATVTAPTATDNCAGTLTATTTDPTSYSTQGTFTVNWTYSDGNGNTTTQSQTVVVDDTIAPVPNASPLADATGQCSATIASTPTATDNCSGTVTATTGDSLTRSTQGTSTVTWTYNDGNGNTATQSQSIVVDDTIAPVPDVASLSSATGECSATISSTPTATDNCAGPITGTTSNPLTRSTQGTSTVTWTYNDGNGNSSNQSQSIVVDDVTAPVPDVASLSSATGECSATISSTPTATDNCAGPITGTTSNPLTRSTQGTSTVTWTYNDGNGNSSNQSQSIVVDDVTAPAPDVASLSSATGECSATISSTPTATDNCAGPITGTTSNPLTRSTQGTSTVTWTYNDGNGNSANQSQSIVVDDVTAPVPNVTTLPTISEQCSATVTAPTATDNCSGPITATTTDPTSFSADGSYTINWKYDDGNGNITTQTQTVIIDDTIAPVPNVTTLPTVNEQCSATVTAPTATDNCAGTLTATTTDPTSFSADGSYTINWKYDDGRGNITTQTQTVIIDDTIAPVPNVATLPTVNEQCSATVTAPTATDNCAGTLTATTTDPTSFSADGSYTINWKYDDGRGNITTQTQTVIIDDTIAPVPNVATLPTVNEQCSATVTAPTATDNCAGTLTATTTDPTSFSADGSYTINWKYDDGRGNITTQTQTVIIDDTIAPVPNVATLPTVNEQCSATVTAPTATDNCAGTLTATTTDPTSFSADGTSTINWKYDDGRGNITTHTQTVIVDDTIAPVPNVATLPTVNEQCSATVTAPTATDNCAGALTATTSDPLTYTTQGTFTINWTYDDGRGNTTTQQQTVIIDDTTAPVPSVASLPNATGQCSVTVTPPTAADNCSGTVSATTTDPLTYTTQGTFTIQWTYDDGNGNTASQQQTVVVQDTIAPTIASTPPDSSVLAGNTCKAPVPNLVPGVSATDNCTAAGSLVITQSPVAGTLVALGTTPIVITVTDAVGQSSNSTVNFTVTNDAPIITSVTGPTDPVPISGNSVSITANFTDTGVQSHTCTFFWDDTTSSTVTVGPGVTSCTASHTYTAPNVYRVGVNVADDCATSAGSIPFPFEFVVIYDPNGGFVTGGGWINSPPGAYLANPAAVGKANLGFVSKYKKGAGAALEGETEFQFKAGDLNFHSTSYEWMVISGAKARYRGKGRINGGTTLYDFELTALDGQASGGGGTDRFRIRIYGVYDNQLGAPDGDDPTTGLGGGSIVIHKPK